MLHVITACLLLWLYLLWWDHLSSVWWDYLSGAIRRRSIEQVAPF
jgi:hypothetical protein